VGAPTAGLVGGDGDRFVLSVGDGSQVPYSLGVDTNKLWSAVPTTASHAWFIGTEEKMTLNSSGYLGVGTTSPYAPLSVVGEVVASHFTATTTATSTFAGGIELLSGNFDFNSSDVWTASGDNIYYLNNVAIGTTSLASRLTVAQSANASSGGISLQSTKIDGYRWTEQTESGALGWFDIASSADGEKLAAVVYNGYVYTSANGGETWTEQTGLSKRGWRKIVSSADGLKLAALDDNYIYTSTDGGVNWTARTGAGVRDWRDIASSADGTKLVAVVYEDEDDYIDGYIYTSTNGGANWTERTSAGSYEWTAVASSDDGTKLVAGSDDSHLGVSTDGGASWTDRTPTSTLGWQAVASSADGTKLVALASGGYIFTSADSGVTWTEQEGSLGGIDVVSSADGTKLAVAALVESLPRTYAIFISRDSGKTWTEQSSIGSFWWKGLAFSADGTKLAAVAFNSNIYTCDIVGEDYLTRSLFIDSAGDFRLSDSTTDFLTVSSDGRFGLGTTSIAAKLNLAPYDNAGTVSYTNGATSEGLGINAYIDTSNSNLGIVDFVALRHSTASSGGSQFRFFTQATSTDNPALAMTIDKDGRVGILTTPDANTKYGLTLPNNVNTGYGRAYTWDTYSDTRIKLNQQPLQYGLAELLQLEPKSFEQHSSRFENGRLILEEASEQTIGLIAQEVYGVIPEAVNPAEDENSSLWGINYDKLTPVIIKAIQELAHKQEEMQAELEESGLKSENIDGLAYVLVHNVQINNLAKFKGETTFEGGALFVNNVNFLASVSFEQRVEFKGGMDIKRGIMIKDKGTGEEYCIFLRDGEEVTEKGNCDQILGETTAAATTTLPTAIPLEMNNGTLMSTSTEATEMVTVESSDPMTATTSSDIVPEVNEAAVIAEVREEEEIETVGTGDSGVAESLEAN